MYEMEGIPLLIFFENAFISLYYYISNYILYLIAIVLMIAMGICEYRDKQFKTVNDERKVV